MGDHITQHLFQIFADRGIQARFVGGCVRDAILDISAHDIDIAVPIPPDEIIYVLLYELAYAPLYELACALLSHQIYAPLYELSYAPLYEIFSSPLYELASSHLYELAFVLLY